MIFRQKLLSCFQKTGFSLFFFPVVLNHVKEKGREILSQLHVFSYVYEVCNDKERAFRLFKKWKPLCNCPQRMGIILHYVGYAFVTAVTSPSGADQLRTFQAPRLVVFTVAMQCVQPTICSKMCRPHRLIRCHFMVW